MNDPTDDGMRRLVAEIHDASPAPHPWNLIGLARPRDRASRSHWRLAIVAVAAVGLSAVGVVGLWAGRREQHVVPDSDSLPGGSASVGSAEPITTVTTTTAAAISTTSRVSTTTGIPTTSVAPTSVAPTTTVADATSTSAAPASLHRVSVSYHAPPPLLRLRAFASVDVPVDPAHPVSVWPVAALDGGRAAIVDGDHHRIIVVEPSGHQTVVPLADDPAPFTVTGGHDVVYGIAQRGTPQNAAGAAAVAIALSGPNAGRVIASREIGILTYVEAPDILGHGKDAVIDRRTGEVVIPYVDTAGGPRSFDVAPPNYRLDADGTVRTAAGAATWALSIERATDWPGSDVGDAPPAQIGDGRAVVETSLGPPVDPSQDIPTPSMPVIAVLEADGSGAWYRVPDGWTLVAADEGGVVFARRVGTTVQLATLPSSTAG